MGVHFLTHTFLFWSYIRMDPYQNPSSKHCKNFNPEVLKLCYLLPLPGCKRFDWCLWPLWTALGISALIEQCRRCCWGQWWDSMQLLCGFRTCSLRGWHASIGLRHGNECLGLVFVRQAANASASSRLHELFCTLLRIFRNADIHLMKQNKRHVPLTMVKIPQSCRRGDSGWPLVHLLPKLFWDLNETLPCFHHINSGKDKRSKVIFVSHFALKSVGFSPLASLWLQWCFQ